MNVSYDNIREQKETIKVIGVGGGGGNTINYLIGSGVEKVDFIAVNTDIQDLYKSKAPTKIQIGEKISGGRGVGSNIELGEKAALETYEELKEAVLNSYLIFITAGMGGGTGTGASPVIARLAREINPDALIIGVVTKPHSADGRMRTEQANRGIKKLREFVDSLLIVPNDSIQRSAGKYASAYEAYSMPNKVLLDAIRGITDIINTVGFQNVDFNDVKRIMRKSGTALIGIGEASGEGRLEKAVHEAVTSPLLENHNINGASGILVNFTASKSWPYDEAMRALEYIGQAAHPEAMIKHGVVYDDSYEDKLKVTVIATQFKNTPGSFMGNYGIRNHYAPIPEILTKVAEPYSEDIDSNENIQSIPRMDNIDVNDLSIPAYLRRKYKNIMQKSPGIQETQRTDNIRNTNNTAGIDQEDSSTPACLRRRYRKG